MDHQQPQQQLLIEDLVLLQHIDEESIKQVLKHRHERNLIYTFIGPVLVSVNPFKNIQNLYDEAQIKKYQARSFQENPPHIFAVAENAYYELKACEENQCIIIAGESGAGKTEASKLIMRYISASSGENRELAIVKQSLMASNPVLESFGNAKTNRNDNSSRFGKYLEIIFDYGGYPVGGLIHNYLLEKVRVIHPTKGERDFHIFYQLLAGIEDPQERSKLHLKQEASDYKYLSKSDVYKVASIDDKKDWKITLESMKSVGFQETEIEEIKRILSALLLIGEFEFKSESDEHSELVDMAPVEKVAELLSIDKQQLQKSMLTRQFEVVGNITTRSLNVAQAEYTRDSLAKSIYGKLFDWIVRKINRNIDPNARRRSLVYDPKHHNVIGVLDIYGFEIFENNSFEQFCINYCNEKLQQIFIEQTLRAEQAEYNNEGIEQEKIDYFNNRIVCDLIERKPQGLLAYLDEDCTLPKSTDESFLVKIIDNLGDHPHLEAITDKKMSVEFRKSNFLIKHYAGDVTYNVEGFLDKNKDLVQKDLILLGEASKLEVFQQIYEGASQNFSKKRPITQGTQFKTQVLSLMDSLSQCFPHYVRCIKPNDVKRADNFDEHRVAHQIKYLGLKENIRVRRAGFAFRAEYTLFLERYKMLAQETQPKQQGSSSIEGVKHILNAMNQTQNNNGSSTSKCIYAFGRTKIFIKNPTSIFEINHRRELKINELATKLQALQKKFVQRRWYLNYLAARKIQAFVRGQSTRRQVKKHRAALKIQHQYRKQKKFTKSLEHRVPLLKLYGDKKMRRTLSVSLFPVGDYLFMASNPHQKKIATKHHDNSRILFSDFALKVNRNFKFDNRIIVLTENGFYSCDYFKKVEDKVDRYDNIKNMMFSRTHKYSSIAALQVSPFPDNYFVLKTPKFATLYYCERKTELLATIINKRNNPNNDEAEKLPLIFDAAFDIKTQSKRLQTIIFENISTTEFNDIEEDLENGLEIKQKKCLAQVYTRKHIGVASNDLINKLLTLSGARGTVTNR